MPDWSRVVAILATLLHGGLGFRSSRGFLADVKHCRKACWAAHALRSLSNVSRSLSQRGASSFTLCVQTDSNVKTCSFSAQRRKKTASGLDVLNGLAAQEIATRLIQPDFKGSRPAIVSAPLADAVPVMGFHFRLLFQSRRLNSPEITVSRLRRDVRHCTCVKTHVFSYMLSHLPHFTVGFILFFPLSHVSKAFF